MSEPKLRRLRAWRTHRAQAEIALGVPSFLGKPHDWYEDVHWACVNGHVSGACLVSDERGDLCLGCGESVIMIEPMTESAFAEIIVKLNEAHDE